MSQLAPPKTSGRLVLCLQFWQGDKEAAMRNARRIADNEPAYRSDVEFMFVARFDCTHDSNTVAHVSRKFKVSTVNTTRKGTGWPSGCNDMFCDLATNAWLTRLFSGEWSDVKAVFAFEADAIPVVPDWIDQLSKEWDIAAAAGKFIVGCWMPPGSQGGPVGHINGNAMYAPDLFHRCPIVLGCPPEVGYDYYFARTFEPHWFKTPLITNYYKARNVTEADIRRVAPDGRVPVVVHGVKDASVENYADRVLKEPSRVVATAVSLL